MITELATCPGVGDKVSALYDLHSVSSNLGPTLTPDRQVGTCGALGTGRVKSKRVDWTGTSPREIWVPVRLVV